MKFETAYIYSFIAPLMIFLSILGLISSKESKKIFLHANWFNGDFYNCGERIKQRFKEKKYF